jgi:phage/plasmid-associated DNA primase
VLLDEIKEGANPAIASLNRKRFVLVQEPNGKRRICTATLKEITGDKIINARMCYVNDCKTNLSLTLVMECNELPALDEVGGGVERRVRAIPFGSRFVDKDDFTSILD